MTTYMSSGATAKLVRQALKESFPGVKFSVRSDNNSIDIRYQDGPAHVLVESVVKTFKGGYFDGMIDYAGSVFHKLDGQRVHFGSSYVFVSRESSDAQILKAIDLVAIKYGSKAFEKAGDDLLAKFKKGELWSVPMFDNWTAGDHSLQGTINKVLAKISTVAAPAKSATLARVEFAGDDGYGQGTVGRNPEQPDGDQCAKAIEAIEANRELIAAVNAGVLS